MDTGQLLEERRRDLNRSVFLLFIAVAGIYLLFSAVNVYRVLNLAMSGWVAAMDTGMLLLSLVLAAWLHHRPRQINEILTTGAILLLGAGINAALSALIGESPRELFYVSFMMVCVGATVTSRRFVWVAGMLGIVTVLMVAIQIGTAEDIVWSGITVVTGVLVSIVVFESRDRSNRRVEALRTHDLEQAEALREAMERVRTELHERILAEENRERAEAQQALLEKQLRQAQKLEALGTLAGGVAHDMNNILGAIKGLASVAAETAEPGTELLEDLEHIVQASDRGASLTRNLLGFARKGKRRSESFNVAELAREVIVLLGRTAPKRIDFALEVTDETATALGDADQISHALLNLCLNAIDATEGQSQLRVSVDIASVEDHPVLAAGRYVTLSVEDRGHGMDEEAQHRCLEPFFSTKEGDHSGLGLSMVFGTLIEHEGQVTIDSTVGMGTTITLWLPAGDDVRPAVAPTEDGGPATDRPILIIDDEALVARATSRMLGNLGLESVSAIGGAEGLALLDEQPGRFGAIILDLRMPSMDGTECLALIRQQDARTPVLLASGYPKDQDVEALLENGADGFITKPFSRADLQAALQEALDTRR